MRRSSSSMPSCTAKYPVRYSSIEEVDEALPSDHFRRDDIPYAAAFLAGKVFLEYRRRGGLRRAPLPEFYIGAHAAVAGFWLLDTRRAPLSDVLPRRARAHRTVTASTGKPRWLTTREAAERAHRDPGLCAAGSGKVSCAGDKVGGHFVIDAADLDDFLAGLPNSLPGPAAWDTLPSGKPMPDVLAAIWRSRLDH